MELSFWPSSLPVTFRIPVSARRERPNREPQFVVCLIATALTPLLIPLIPSFRQMSMKVSNVPGGFTPFAAILCFVISTVFMHVQKPIVAYAWATPPAIPPDIPPTKSLAPKDFA